MEKQLRGIAVILFGMLLCCAESGLNNTVFARTSDMPISAIGVIIGIAGLIIALTKETGSSE